MHKKKLRKRRNTQFQISTKYANKDGTEDYFGVMKLCSPGPLALPWAAVTATTLGKPCKCSSTPTALRWNLGSPALTKAIFGSYRLLMRA
jgi:hypothetical protein